MLTHISNRFETEWLTFIGTSYPLQGSDIIIVLPDRKGKNPYLEKNKKRGVCILAFMLLLQKQFIV